MCLHFLPRVIEIEFPIIRENGDIAFALYRESNFDPDEIQNWGFVMKLGCAL